MILLKPFWKSKSLIGLIVAGIAMGTGVDLSGVINDGSIAELMSQDTAGIVVAFGGLAFAAYGRVVANKKLSIK